MRNTAIYNNNNMKYSDEKLKLKSTNFFQNPPAYFSSVYEYSSLRFSSIGMKVIWKRVILKVDRSIDTISSYRIPSKSLMAPGIFAGPPARHSTAVLDHATHVQPACGPPDHASLTARHLYYTVLSSRIGIVHAV